MAENTTEKKVRHRKFIFTKDHFDALESYLTKKLLVDVSAELVFECFKIGAFSKEYAEYILQWYKTGDDSSKYFASEDLNVYFINSIYSRNNINIAKFFVQKLQKRERKRLFETYKLSPIEQYVYTLLEDARKNGKTLTTSQILTYVKMYKFYKIENVEYFKKLVQKIRNKVRMKIDRNKLTE